MNARNYNPHRKNFNPVQMTAKPKTAPKPKERKSKQKKESSGSDSDSIADGIEDMLRTGRKSTKEGDTINLLIMGETGVGKSTFINALYNYNIFHRLEDALKHPDQLSLIQTPFVIFDKHSKKHVVSTNGHLNGSGGAAGESATQFSQVYEFPFRDTEIRIIDTPGIGDVRGSEKDGQTLDNILSIIGKLDVLHGILILLKSNNSRVNVLFRNCVNDLLLHLDESVANNIMFGFTHCRETNYLPGDTLPVLQRLLESNPTVKIPLTNDNTFCFDSDSFRFLAAKKFGVAFSFDISYYTSWENSAAETDRLLRRLSEISPFSTQKTTKTCRDVVRGKDHVGQQISNKNAESVPGGIDFPDLETVMIEQTDSGASSHMMGAEKRKGSKTEPGTTGATGKKKNISLANRFSTDETVTRVEEGTGETIIVSIQVWNEHLRC